MSSRRRIALIAVVCAQLALPLGLAAVAAADLAFGQEIRLRARPVDPLDVFRGNYVVLTYEISTLPTFDAVRRGDRICTRLRKASGNEWYGDSAVLDRRPSGTAICGRARNNASPGERVSVEYGIETYFASAERAKEIEEGIARGRVFAVIDLDDDGSARLERLEVEV